MGPPQRVLIVYAVLALVVVAVFVAVAASTAGPRQDYHGVVQPRGYAVRRYWFLALVAAVVAGLALTLPFGPYSRGGAASAAGSGTRIPVVARQYSFAGLPEVVPYGTPVVFVVTSADVNHGFAIYDPRGRLVGQVQAMPEYDNELPVTFTERGRYTVRCLEYCGINHHDMRATFEVR
ncbi:MAG TPA: hypothetical protein VF202_06570 [Trueperaceae bacterium]